LNFHFFWKLSRVLALMTALVEFPIAQQRYELTPLVNKTMAARVDSIVDGDTVHVQLADGRKLTVRLDGVDTPETGEPFAAQARNATRVLLFDRQVQLTVTDVDRYDRLVGRVRLGTTDASVELVNAGLACHFTRYSADPVLAAAQLAAKDAHRGFWAVGVQKPQCVTGGAAAKPATTTAAPATTTASKANGPFHGNVSSRVYHSSSCKNYSCKSCTAVFESEDAAKRAGYRAAGDCIGK